MAQKYMRAFKEHSGQGAGGRPSVFLSCPGPVNIRPAQLLAGLAPGLAPGLIPGLAPGLAPGFILGLIPGLIPGLVLGFILGLALLTADPAPALAQSDSGAISGPQPPVVKSPTPPTPPREPPHGATTAGRPGSAGSALGEGLFEALGLVTPQGLGEDAPPASPEAGLAQPDMDAAPPETPLPPLAGYASPQDLARFSQTAREVWRKIQRAYPDFVADLEIQRTAQGLFAYLKPLAGDKILLADQRARKDQDLWDHPSLADTLHNPQAAPYPVGEGGRDPQTGFSPGRARNTELLKALYGQTPQEVRAACESVDFLGQKVLFNSRHGAAAALRRVAQRLAAHLAEHPQDSVWVLPLAGTLAQRQVAGSAALSAHAFAVAMDLSTAQSPYWRWRPAPDIVQNARANFPQAIVAAFEAEHFVWGGKWHAYDFMHFEYRPEIVE